MMLKFNRLHVVAFINVIPMMIACAEKLPKVDREVCQVYTSSIRTMVKAGTGFFPTDKSALKVDGAPEKNNALAAYITESNRIWVDPSSILPETRRPKFESLWDSLCKDTEYQLARQKLQDPKYRVDRVDRVDDTTPFIQIAAIRTGKLVAQYGVKFDFEKSVNREGGRNLFFEMNKGMSQEASEYMLAGTVVVSVLICEAKKIMDAKARKTPVGKKKQ